MYRFRLQGKVFLSAVIVGFMVASTSYADLSHMSLPEVYALSEAELEQELENSFKSDAVSCEATSVIAVGGQDPAGLTPLRACVVGHYSKSWYYLNAKLWDTDSSGSLLNGVEWAFVRLLDLALSQIQSEPTMTVYRGTSKALLALEKGKETRLKGYTSTSVDQEVAEGFIDDRLMIFTVHSGKNITIYSNAGHEEEILLPRSTWVHVDDIVEKTLTIFDEEQGQLVERQVEVVYVTEVDK